MRSPFPGVDPFIEGLQSWPDFHSRFMNCWCEAIADQLPDHYFARLEETVEMLDHPGEVAYVRQPDILVIQREAAAAAAPAIATLAGALTPVMIPLVVEEEHRQTSISIVHWPDMNVVTVVELLSPTNKGSGYHQYLTKRRQILRQQTHLVELDLLTGGRRLLPKKTLPQGDALAFISRAEKRQYCETYGWMLQDRLPPLPIPLAAPDTDIFVELQSIYDDAYARGRYSRFLRYSRPIELDVSPQTMAWVEETARLHVQSYGERGVK